MPRLPRLSGRQLVRALTKIGYHAVRQRGSHIRLACPGRKSVTVPDHKTIGPGLLRKILRDVDVSPGDLVKFIK